MDQPRRNLKRYEGLNDARYLTCSCYRRLALFSNDAIKREFVKHLIFVQQALHFEVYAWVLMPEHFHMIVGSRDILTQHTAPFETLCGTQNGGHDASKTITNIIRRIKAPFAQRVLTRWRTLNAPALSRIQDPNGKHRFWQHGGGYDRNLFSFEELQEKIQYIHTNPVRRGLADQPSDYPWSSAAHYESPAEYAGPVITRLM